MSSWEKWAHEQNRRSIARKGNPLKEAWHRGFSGSPPLGDYTPNESASYERGRQQRAEQTARHQAGDFSYRPERYDY